MAGRSIRGGGTGLICEGRNRNYDEVDRYLFEERELRFTRGEDLNKDYGWGGGCG